MLDRLLQRRRIDFGLIRADRSREQLFHTVGTGIRCNGAVSRESGNIARAELSRDRQRLARGFLELSILDFAEHQNARHQSAFASSRMYLRISLAALAGSPPSILRPPLFSAGNSRETTV